MNAESHSTEGIVTLNLVIECAINNIKPPLAHKQNSMK